MKPSYKFCKKTDKYKFPFIAAGSSALVMFGVYLANIIYPLGGNSILSVDLYHQYAPLFTELWDKLMSGGSLLFSWQIGGGMAWLGNFFNYLSSPFTFLICLFPRENITEAVALIIFLKHILASFTFSLFINKHSQNKSPLISVFGVLYAGCGWFVAYFWNIMWLDALYLLPLVALGIEKLIDTKKSAFYIITLALTFFTNYYMAYMVCIFSVAYFLYYFILNSNTVLLPNSKITLKNIKNNLFINRGFNFVFSSVCAVLICAVALLPVFISLSSSSATGDTFPKEFNTHFNIFDFFVQHLTSINPTIFYSSESDFLPNISCGIISVMLLPLFFFTKTITKKEKIISTALLGFFAVGFYINYIDFIWHGFHYPNSLPYRYSFMYCFVLLLIGFRTVSHIKEIPVKYIKLTAFSLTVFLLITQKLGSENFDELAFGINLAFIIIYLFILLLLSNGKTPQKTVAILLLILVCTEYTIGNSSKYDINVSREDYIYDYTSFCEIKEKLDQEEDSFYRMDMLKSRPSMSPSQYGYNGISFFSSMANEQHAKAQKLLGTESNNINSAIYNSQTPVYNAFFNIKYVLNSPFGSDQRLPAEFFELKTRNIDFMAYENLYSLPLGFAVDKKIVGVSFDHTNPFINQENLFKSATGVENVFDYMEITNIKTDNLNLEKEDLIEDSIADYSVKYRGDASVEITLRANIEGKAYIYICSENETIDTIEYSLNNSSSSQDVSVSPYIHYVGHIKKGGNLTTTINIPLEKDGKETEFIEDTFHIYGAVVNNEQFEKGYNKLKNSLLTINNIDDTHLSGTVKLPKDSVLYTSIPYDNGWHLTVDGKPADDKIIVIGNSLIAIDSDEGSHTIEMTYTPDGLYEGLAISFSTLAVLIAILIFQKSKKKK